MAAPARKVTSWPRRGLPAAAGAAWLAIALLASGCATPQVEETTAAGDHVVTTWSRLLGLDATKRDNADAAEATCPEGYIILRETIGQDDDGNFRRWEYGCLER